MPEPSDSDIVQAFRAEVGKWTLRREPNLVDLAGRPHPWQGPVVWASGLGATGLAVLLVLSAFLVLVHPAFPGSNELVERLSLVRP